MRNCEDALVGGEMSLIEFTPKNDLRPYTPGVREGNNSVDRTLSCIETELDKRTFQSSDISSQRRLLSALLRTCGKWLSSADRTSLKCNG